VRRQHKHVKGFEKISNIFLKSRKRYMTLQISGLNKLSQLHEIGFVALPHNETPAIRKYLPQMIHGMNETFMTFSGKNVCHGSYHNLMGLYPVAVTNDMSSGLTAKHVNINSAVEDIDCVRTKPTSHQHRFNFP